MEHRDAGRRRSGQAAALRCGSCGARVGGDAAWCSLCHTRVPAGLTVPAIHPTDESAATGAAAPTEVTDATPVTGVPRVAGVTEVTEVARLAGVTEVPGVAGAADARTVDLPAAAGPAPTASPAGVLTLAGGKGRSALLAAAGALLLTGALLAAMTVVGLLL